MSVPLAVSQVSKVYGRTRALSDVDLALDAGQLCALLGPNGAGKSTLLGIAASLIRPTSGRVLYGGDPDPMRSEIGFCGHASLVYSDLTLRENLDFFARYYAVGDRLQRVETLLERFALTEAADRPVRVCSRGTIQRLSLARALVHRPRLLLCDEPFAGLDAESVAIARTILREEAAAGVLVIVSSHDLAALSGLASRVLVLRRGCITTDYRSDIPLDEASLRGRYSG